MSLALSAAVRAVLALVFVLVIAVEGTVFAFVLYAQALDADGHFRGGLAGFLFHLTVLLLAIIGLRAIARDRRRVDSVG